MKRSTGLDLGRLLLVPVFTGLMLLNAATLIEPDNRPFLVRIATIGALVFYAVLTLMYIRRGSATHTDRRPRVWLVAGTATVSPFAIPVLATKNPGSASAAAGAVLVVLGIVLAIWAALILATNISVVPQSRTLATTGPYRVFRHPLYLFEYVTAIGLTLLVGGGWAWLVVFVLGVLQVMRGRWEEQLLGRKLSGYAEYAARTPGFS